jgi:hypothetical protein
VLPVGAVRLLLVGNGMTVIEVLTWVRETGWFLLLVKTTCPHRHDAGWA